MKKIIIFFTASLILVVCLPGISLASGANPTRCNTKYPIILANGMGFSAEVLGIVDVCWGIEDALKKEGARVYKTSVNGMDSTADKVQAPVSEILAVTGA